ncbi:hypothetical protein B5X24_HaOG205246 [Helicoverpa armigera]|uniref:Uncharacterized protein n=1 Tax=Helicoverpa armigera TaxID=29058 RepID=A0A2W1BQV9_HELAM|nr:hypothetical protein B5X24_HaOG205246 [Helicoverpa armigera]
MFIKFSSYLGVDEEDRVSLDQKSETDPLDSKQKQWILCAARGDYHALAKMCKENAKLVKTKQFVQMGPRRVAQGTARECKSLLQ